MFNLNEHLISEYSTNHSTFVNGKKYHYGNRVKSIVYDKKRYRFNSVVSGTKNYNVIIDFDRAGDIDDASCTCPAYGKYWGYCKHIVAVLLSIHDRDRKININKTVKEDLSKNILDFFRDKVTDIKTPISIEVNYEYEKSIYKYLEDLSYLNIRMGEEKLYVVKNIKKFFEKFEDGEIIEFGKDFTFDPQKHRFKEEDKLLIDFLKELYEYEKTFNESSYGLGKRSLFQGKNIRLTQSSLKRFFNIIKNRSFNAKILGEVYKDINVIKEDISINFELTKQNKDLLLRIDYNGTPIPLTSDGQYFFYEDNVYNISDYQKENLKPFYNTVAKQDSNIIKIPSEHNEMFLTEVFPYLKKLGNINVDESVERSIYKPKLNAEVYLDKENNSVLANIKFIYGDITITPFSSNERNEETNERILIRDLEKEKEILTLFEESNFKVRNNHIHLSNEEGIYDFIYDKIGKLQEISEIFYSESFNSIKIYDASSFTGGIRLNKDSDLLEFSFKIDNINNSELIKALNSIKENKKYFKLKDGSFLPLESDELKKLANIVDYLDLDKSNFKDDLIQIPKFRALYLDEELKNLGFNNIKRNTVFKELVQNIKEPGDTDFIVPESLDSTLREYQKFGYMWLKTLSSYGMGGILADDMGLGKTLQVITFLLSEKIEKGNAPSLVVAPSSLVYNWESEVQKFSPDLKTLVIAGNKEERYQVIEDIMSYDIVITSYPLIRRDIDLYKNITFRYCFIDEAQHIKNPSSQNAKSIKEIKANNYFALTGTPIENSLTELWSIFDFIMPGYLLSYSKFLKKYEKPIVKEKDINALKELGNQIRPFIIRRLKKDVLKELPEKIENKVIAELNDEQKKIYLAYLKDIKGEIENEIKNKGFERSHIKILAGLTRLRQICCHPAVFLDDFKGNSGKMELLEEIIDDSLESGHRILLFSQFTSMLKLIKDVLIRKGIDYLYLDGSTKTIDRGRLVKDFNDGYGNVFLISLRAGGTGLNLTGADTVIHFDPWWNPAVEDQATDRAYRIGQKNTVHVIKLITKGTIEEKIFELQQRKKEMINSVIKPGETLISKLSENEIKNLFEL